MSILVAVAHIVGSLLVLVVLGVLLLLVGTWESERNKKRVFQEAAAKLGVTVDVLNEERLTEKIVQFSSERSSNELLRNRISDLCGVVRTLWGWIGSMLQVLALGATVWFTLTENLQNALFAWVAPGIALFFWVISVLFSLLCYVLTGRYPGEAKLARKSLAQFLNERGSQMLPPNPSIERTDSSCA